MPNSYKKVIINDNCHFMFSMGKKDVSYFVDPTTGVTDHHTDPRYLELVIRIIELESKLLEIKLNECSTLLSK